MVIRVKKKSGRLQVFKKSKIIKSCRKAGASPATCKKVANYVAKKAKDKMPTSKIKKMVMSRIRKYDRKAAMNFKKFRRR